jgi:hypothetical protein
VGVRNEAVWDKTARLDVPKKFDPDIELALKNGVITEMDAVIDDALTLPLIVNLLAGLAVPIPTFPV